MDCFVESILDSTHEIWRGEVRLHGVTWVIRVPVQRPTCPWPRHARKRAACGPAARPSRAGQARAGVPDRKPIHFSPGGRTGSAQAGSWPASWASSPARSQAAHPAPGTPAQQALCSELATAQGSGHVAQPSCTRPNEKARPTAAASSCRFVF